MYVLLETVFVVYRYLLYASLVCTEFVIFNSTRYFRVCLRSTDYGAVLNSGLSITTFIFLDSLPPALNVFRAKVNIVFLDADIEE